MNGVLQKYTVLKHDQKLSDGALAEVQSCLNDFICDLFDLCLVGLLTFSFCLLIAKWWLVGCLVVWNISQKTSLIDWPKNHLISPNGISSHFHFTPLKGFLASLGQFFSPSFSHFHFQTVPIPPFRLSNPPTSMLSTFKVLPHLKMLVHSQMQMHEFS